MDHNMTQRAKSALSDFEDIYTRRDFENQMQLVEETTEADERNARVLPNLYRMFESLGIKYERNREDSYYENLIKESVPEDLNWDKAVDRAMLILYDKSDVYYTPSMFLDRLVKRLMKPQDARKWNSFSLRTRILKQFIKYGHCLGAAGYGSEATIWKYVKNKIEDTDNRDYAVMADNVYDDIFDDFDQNTSREAVKPHGKYGLLKLCDDLASGKFRSQGSTKKGLYYFAMVFDMGIDGMPGGNKDNDVISNLFRDYYDNNLMNYITEAYDETPDDRGASRNNRQEYEEPSGQGVNYKNYAEMVYLYFIARSDMQPVEKIEKSVAMIQEIKEEAASHDPQLQRVTQSYRDHFISLMSKSEEDFREYILDNYDCGQKEMHISNQMILSTEQNTAKRVFEELCEKAKKYDIYEDGLENGEINIDDPDIPGEMRDSAVGYDAVTGLWFDGGNDDEWKKIESLPARYQNIDKKKYAAFIKVLKKANEFLIDKMKKVDENTVSRISIIDACYYCFQNYDSGDMEMIGFRGVYKKFKEKTDEYLRQCGYQEISYRNFFDMLVVFSAYAIATGLGEN